MNMKVLMTFAVLFTLSFPAAAQEPNRSKGQGYLLFASGVSNIGPGSAALQIGGGGEGFIYRGLGFGIEILAVGTDWVVGLGSANFSYHLLPRTKDRKLEPFVTAGYSTFFRHGIVQGYNVGGGVNVWLNKNVGMRFEVRDHEAARRYAVGFRIGVTFR